ncbi:hypothetical protein [Saccharopolyspora sp. NPDC002376]
MTAVLNAPKIQPELSQGEIEEITSFRFTDLNPQMNRSLCQSMFRDLPEFVQDIVEDKFDLCAGEWDELVKMGDVLEFTGAGSHKIPSRIASVQRQIRRGNSRRNVCEDCDGTCVQIDWDGSITGEPGTPAWCFCTRMAAAA